MPMILKNMKIGLMPYADGSGYTFEVSLISGMIQIEQGSSRVDMKRDEWEVVSKAIAKLWIAQDDVGG